MQNVDEEVAARVRQRRVELGLTQQQLAEQIGVTYQQAHKYETGINRISAGRLYQIAQALGTDVNYFFGEAGPRPQSNSSGRPRLMVELARNFAHLPRRHQEALVQLARVMAAEPMPVAPEFDDAGDTLLDH
jgi:transcriptional regulator with XRE-family HTH domain